MPSSLKPQTAVPGISDVPGDWRVLPGMESETILKTPRGEIADLTPPPTPMPSFWKLLFPAPSEVSTAGQPGDPAQGVTLGHFTIERRIGSGAMGSVFLAFDERLQREVALKVLAPAQATDNNTVQRFQNEAQAAARLDHEHIARVFYYGEERGLHFIAYEYVPGLNLRDVIRQRGRFSSAEAVNYAIQIATALRHTSRHGVVHRDIKPSNIIITPNGRAKLVDLGLAKRDNVETGGELTVAGTTLGTFDYISPEQARDPRAVDVRSDIYSLGCTLYHLLTGEPPYPEGTVLQKLLDHQAHDTPDVLTKNRRVSPAFAAVIKKMMASDVKRRYSTPEELLRDLAQIARGLSLRVVSSDSAALVPEARLQGTWWDRNFGWVLTVAALLLIVATLQAVPPEQFERWSLWLMNSGAAPSSNGAPIVPETISPANVADNDISPDAGLKPVDKSVEIQQPSDPPSFDPADDEVASSDMKSETDDTDKPVVEPSPETGESDVATAGDDRLPAISIVAGGARTSFVTLEQACLDAKDGDIIELRWDGPRAGAEQTLRIANKHLHIRAAKGCRPQLEFADAGRAGEQPVSRVIGVTGGSLKIFNVDLVAHVSPSYSGADWSLFALDRPESLKLDGVTVTVVNPRRRAASVVEFGSSGGAPGSGMIKSGVPFTPPVLQISHSVIRGAAVLITVRDADAGRYAVEDSLIALDDSLLQIMTGSMMAMGENQPLKLELQHTTAVLNGSLIVTRSEDNLSDEAPPLHVAAQNNLISVGREQPLIDLSISDAMELRDSFVWSGERNLYNDVKSFWVIRSRQSISPAPLDFAAWKEFWDSDISGSASVPVRWVSDIRTVPLHEFRLEDAALATSGGPNPAISAATDGTDLGAPLDKLPKPPKIEAAK